ncbi:MAG TPA: peptide ABC transporter substrate-binding protein [Woeseiaceae bacterium]|nr:peptide ABC transporter substrate-binding protein [Woeseiaceae bacterium]
MKSLRLLLQIIALAALVACGGAGESDDRSAILSRAISTDPETLDIHKARSLQALDVLRDLGEGLVSHTATGELTPGVAESWEMSADGLSYTFKLRADARWSTGEAVTAGDFVFAVKRLKDPATGAFYAQFLNDVTRLEAVDDQTLLIRLAQPTPYLLSLLTHPATFPLHAGSFATHGDRFARPGNLVSNGAYRLVDWVPGSVITLKRNEHYWNNVNTAIDEVRHLVLVQESTQLARYRAGEIDITSTVPSENFAQTRKVFGSELRIAPYQNVYYYGYNLRKPPFKDNQKLRQALSMAINRDVLVEKVLGRGETPAYSWVPTGINGYVPTVFSYTGLTQEERNQIARRLYKEAGFGEQNPLEVEIRYNSSDTHRAIAVAVQSMWRDALGFDATLVNEEFQVLLANIRAGEVTQVFRSSWVGDYDDAHTFLSVFQSDNSANDPGYSSKEFDKLMMRASKQVDPDLRRAYLEEAERVLLEDHPVIPIYFYVSKHLVSPRVEGWGDNFLDYHYSQHLSLKAAN